MNALRIPIVLVASAALVLSGCSTSDPGSAGSPTPTPPAPTPTPFEGFSYGPSTAPHGLSPGPGVFVGGQAMTYPRGVDEVDLWFDQGDPDCDVRYVDPPIADEQTGTPVEIEGAAFIQVRCEEVTGIALDPYFDTQAGSDRFSAAETDNVTEVVQTGYDGSALTWTIGLQRRMPFQVNRIGPLDPAAPTAANIMVMK
jgi:hypothetical protein